MDGSLGPASERRPLRALAVLAAAALSCALPIAAAEQTHTIAGEVC